MKIKKKRPEHRKMGNRLLERLEFQQSADSEKRGKIREKAELKEAKN